MAALKWRLYFDGYKRPMIPGPFNSEAEALAWQERYGFATLTPYITARQDSPSEVTDER